MIDELWPEGPRFKTQTGTFKLGTDSVMLANFVKPANNKKRIQAADLGCGTGIISIIMAWENPNLTIDGIEIQPESAQLAAENVKLCGLDNRINIIEADLRKHRELLQSGAYDIVVANPPYYPIGSGKTHSSANIATARSEENCTLEDICNAAAYLTRWGGSLMLVHKPERLSDIFRCMNATGFEPKRLRCIQYKSHSAPNLVLIEGRRGGNPSLTIEPPLILANNDNTDSDEIKSIYHRQ